MCKNQFPQFLTRVAFVGLLALTKTLAGDTQDVAVMKPRLAAVPPMGWNSWEAFRKELDENALKAQVDAMVGLGLRDAGYVYFVIDGGWKSTERDANGDLVADPKKFPSGMKTMADYGRRIGMVEERAGSTRLLEWAKAEHHGWDHLCAGGGTRRCHAAVERSQRAA
jgi:hypothetical protein